MSDNSSSLLGKIAVYTEILSKDSQSTVFVSLCEAYRQLGMLEDALEIAEKGTLRLPGFSPGFTALGRIYAQRGDFADAVRAFERALDIEGDNSLALKGLARVKYRQGDSNQARVLLEKVLAQKPDDAMAQKMLDSLGVGIVQTAGTAPSNASIFKNKAAEDDTPSVEEAPGSEVAAEESNAEASSTPIPTETVADLYRKQGLLGEAASIYRALLRRDPHNEKIRHKLVDLKHLMEDQTADVTEPGLPSEPPALEVPISAGDADSGLENSESVIEASDSEPVVEAATKADITSAAENLSSEEQVLRRLDLWLKAIDQRRVAHV